MGRKITTVSLDEDILKKAKKDIPNLSMFIEDCLKAYIGMNDNDNFIADIQENLDNIKQSQLNIHILTKNDLNISEVKEFDEKKSNNSWLKIWGVYRNTQQIHEATVMEVAEALNCKHTLLIDMMQTLLLYETKQDLAKCDNWNYAIQRYKQILNGA